jgi:hypothetical protein
VFTTVTGTPFRPDRMTRLFAKLVAASGMPPVTLHGAATLALAAGADLKVVQDQLGHSTITLTADTYTSVLPETARTAAERTAALLFPARQPSPAGGLRQSGHTGDFRPGHERATARAATPPDCTASPPALGAGAISTVRRAREHCALPPTPPPGGVDEQPWRWHRCGCSASGKE